MSALTTITNSPAMLTVFGKIMQNIETGGALVEQYRECAKQSNDDFNLYWLAGAIGRIPAVIPKLHPMALLHAASIAWAWLEDRCVDSSEVPELIARERVRQLQLFRAKKFVLWVASPVPSAERKLRVVLEELGEVAEAIDKLEVKNTADHRDHFLTELVQVTAVLVAWLESFEAQL